MVDSLQLAAEYPVATPADWQQGDEVMIAPRVSNEEADKLVSGQCGGWARQQEWGQAAGL